MSANEANNQRVTLAVLAEKIDALRGDLQAYCTIQLDHSSRLRDLEVKTTGNQGSRLRDLELGQQDLKVRLSLFAGAQMVVSIVLSAIAAWLGSKY